MEEKNQIHEQDRVLAVKNKSVIVSASAGSGKTHTMINKIYKTLIEEKIDVSSLLVLTYTDAAATEMKLRLNGLLTERLATGENVEFLQDQLSKISVADISTFHSFYEKLIKSNYYYLNINPAFSILEDAEAEILKDKAFSIAFNKLKSEEEKFLKLFTSFSKKRNENALKKRVYRLFDFLSAEADEQSWLKNISLKLIENPQTTIQIVEDFYNENIAYYINLFDEILKQAVLRDETKIVEHCNDALSGFSGILKSAFEEKQRKISEFSFKTFAARNVDMELAEKLKSSKEGFKDFARKVKEENLSTNFSDLEKTKEKYELFLELYKTFVSELNKLKVEKSAYDFSDLERMALLLLQNEKVREKVKAQYKHVFVDEFQDVNNLQNAILGLVCKNNNTFIVGDPKQSIYAFRQSDVQLFMDKQKEFNSSNFAESLSLKNNYRSNKAILDFCNSVFAKIITEKTTGLDYKQTSMFESDGEIKSKFAPVNFVLCKKEEKKVRDALSARYSVFNATTVKAEHSLEVGAIYNQIVNLIGKEIYDKDIKGFRPINYGDIAILVRKRGKITNGLAQIFEQMQIPYLINAEQDLKKSKLVVAFISALRFASGYYSEIDLTTVLNKFFNVSFNELSKVKLAFAEATFKEAVMKYAELEDEIAEKINKFKNVMAEFKFQISVVGIYLALNFLIKNSSFEDFRKNVKGLNEEGLMLNSFFKFVKESKFDENLIQLLNLINKNDTLKVSQVSGGGLDRVTITTIHSSKGLEYPVVILAGLNSDLQGGRLDDKDIKIHKNYGIALKDNEDGKTIFEKAIKIIEKKEALAENLRLLYVAMTRAKNHLFMFAEGDFSKIEEVNEDNIAFAPTKYINYILGSIDKKGIDAVKQELDIAEDCAAEVGYSIKHIKREDLNLVELNDKGVTLTSEEKEEVAERILKINSKKYTDGNARFISQKTSVTELLIEGISQESVSFEPDNFNLSEHLSGIKAYADLGTAMHEIMERADISASFDKLKGICEDVYSKHINNGIELPNDFVSQAQKVCYEALRKIKGLISEGCKIYKEKKFMVYASQKEVLGAGANEKVLVQGIVDFFAVGEKIVLIDYKYSNINSEIKLKNKYKNQLKIYAYAIEKFLNRKVDACYLLNLKSGQVIKF